MLSRLVFLNEGRLRKAISIFIGHYRHQNPGLPKNSAKTGWRIEPQALLIVSFSRDNSVPIPPHCRCRLIRSGSLFYTPTGQRGMAPGKAAKTTNVARKATNVVDLVSVLEESLNEQAKGEAKAKKSKAARTVLTVKRPDHREIFQWRRATDLSVYVRAFQPAVMSRRPSPLNNSQ